jgi:hypothetical protein
MNYCSASLALECAGPPPYYTNDCVNPEVESKNLAITKLVLDVVDDTFGAYAHCNVCANGTECDPPEQLSDRSPFRFDLLAGHGPDLPRTPLLRS